MPIDITQLQPQAWTILARSFQSERLAGTYLLSGPDGCGRWALAMSLASLINCENIIDDKASSLPRSCGECRNCRAIRGYNFEGQHFAVPLPPHKKADEAIDLTNQFLVVKQADPFAMPSSSANITIPIDVARRIKRSLAMRAPEGIHRFIVFHQMERMLASSADALLKLIEEPPADTVIILTTENPERLLPTIQSRSQNIRLRRTPTDVLAKYLQENCSIQRSKADLLARVSQGNVGQAMAMVESDAEDGHLQRGVGMQLFRSLVEDSSSEIIARVTNAIGPRNRSEALELLRLWQSFICDCAGLAVAPDQAELTNIDFDSELRRLAHMFTTPDLGARLAAQIKITLADLRRNVHIHGSLAALVLRLKAEMTLMP
ncbi:MAG: hypothetical protein KOO62_02475 [candidate division Zixibacteria bacterium]|nr:hypothetical protein [candidate division Zixibacteria bacterium]